MTWEESSPDDHVDVMGREKRLFDIFKALGIGMSGVNNTDRDRSEEAEFPWRYHQPRGKAKMKRKGG